jgi:hypothetical protein
MDELEQIKEMIETFKETLVFLVEQEKVRGEEVAALNEKIESVNDILVNQIINPSIEAYNEEQYQGFKDKYGEQLGKFDETLRTSMNDPEYDSTREAWDELQALPEEEREGVDEEAYVKGVEEGLSEYVDNIKKSLGIDEDAAVEIKEDENGEIEVKADTDGDGEVDTEVTEEKTETEVENGEDSGKEVVEEETEEEETDEVDPELQKELEDYLNK